MQAYISGYRKLIVWIEAKSLTLLIYKLTENFPKSEDFGMKSQMRCAVVSIMSQIAEGWLRRSKKDKLRYLEIAEGSLLELESLGEVAFEVGYWKQDNYKSFNTLKSCLSSLSV